MAEYENEYYPGIIIELELNGTKDKREIISIFNTIEGNCYFALSPFDESGKLKEDIIELIRATPLNDGEDYELAPIETEKEFELASATFDAIWISQQGNEPIDEASDLVIQLSDENGENEEYSVIDIFEHNGDEYVALVSSKEVDENNVTVRLMRINREQRGHVEGFNVIPILSDDEYEAALSVFEGRMLDS